MLGLFLCIEGAILVNTAIESFKIIESFNGVRCQDKFPKKPQIPINESAVTALTIHLAREGTQASELVKAEEKHVAPLAIKINDFTTGELYLPEPKEDYPSCGSSRGG